VFSDRPVGETVWPDNIRFLGAYSEAGLGELVARVAPTATWFPAQAIETFCYALSELLRLRRPVVASDLGALSERLLLIEGCHLVPHDAEERVWLRHLLAASADVDLVFDTTPDDTDPFYPGQYTELVVSNLLDVADTEFDDLQVCITVPEAASPCRLREAER
jgi:hypothetical protein